MHHSMENRYTSLQILRGVAAWMLVFHHYMQIYFNFEAGSALGRFFVDYGTLGVPIFFVISGFVMYLTATKPSQSAGAFLINRIFRIAPAYWFCTFGIVAFVHLLPVEFAYTSYNFKALFHALVFLPAENPSGIGVYPPLTVGWTLNFEMFFYFVLAISLWISKKNGILICACLIVVMPIVIRGDSAALRVVSSNLLFLFVAGLMMAAAYTNAMFLRYFAQYSVLLALLCLAIIAASGLLMHHHSAFKLPLAVAVVALALLADPYVNRAHGVIKLLETLGDASYSTYLVHTMVIGIFLHFSGNVFSMAGQILNLVLICIGVGATSLAMFRYLETNSLIRNARDRLIQLIRPMN